MEATKKLTNQERQKLHKWGDRCMQLMTQFGLTNDAIRGWRFEWFDAKRTYGWCSYRKRTIGLSRTYVLHTTNEADIEDTIRHEIGHALAPAHAGHGPKWKALARTVGFNPVRCSSAKLQLDQYKYVGTCPNGHKSFRHRKTKSQSSCSKCCPTYNRNFLVTFMSIKEAKQKGLITDTATQP